MTTPAHTATLTKLGRAQVSADRELETFPATDAGQVVVLRCAEFTCRCPVTGQPDWADIDITYTPGTLLVETKSLKLYLETYREQGIFHEHLAAVILADLVAALAPAACTVAVKFHARGGIAVEAISTYVGPEPMPLRPDPPATEPR